MFIHIIFNAFVLLRWTQEELKKVIALLHNPEFDSKDIDPDLHQRMHNAVLDGRIKCFNMREPGDKDGDQDLNLWARELEDVLREIMEDPVFKGNQNFKFEMYIVHHMYIHVMIQFISVYHVYRHVYTAYRPVHTDFQP